MYKRQKFVQQYITEKFPRDIEFNRQDINVGTFDIETDYDNGFPHPSEASQTVLSITYKSSKFSTYHVWGYGEFDTTKALIKDVKYIKCNSEEELLRKFLEFWSHPEVIPDVITGWNVRFFDIPYLVNRVSKVLGIGEILKFSPWGLNLEAREIVKRGKTEVIYLSLIHI